MCWVVQPGEDEGLGRPSVLLRGLMRKMETNFSAGPIELGQRVKVLN